MARCFRLLPLLALICGCQRLDEEPGPATSAASADGTDDGAGTFSPGADSDGDDADDGAQGLCDPVEQSGCADGERCTVTSSSGGAAVFGCVEDDGDLEPFDPCDTQAGGQDGCSAGHACVADFNGSGACLPLCNGSSDCDVGVCSGSTFGDIPYCADDCSPFEPLCVAPTQCRRNGERFSCRIPQEADVGAAGAPCSPSDDGGCTTGFVCIPGALVPDCKEQNCCASLCDLESASGCLAPATCNSALTAAAPGFESIGACFVPS